jgi:hypothetical protein
MENKAKSGMPDFFGTTYQKQEKYTKNIKLPQNVPNGYKIHIPNGYKIYQMAIKHTKWPYIENTQWP